MRRTSFRTPSFVLLGRSTGFPPGRTIVLGSTGLQLRRTLPLEKALHLPERNGDLESLVETRRLAGKLGDIIRALPARQRIALLQRKYQELSYQEIAATLDCSEETARAHVYQAMGKIRRGLAVARK
jgi:RNA polymerase sigma factor (sigma-70 family)